MTRVSSSAALTKRFIAPRPAVGTGSSPTGRSSRDGVRRQSVAAPVVFFGAAGTHHGSWLFVQKPTARRIEASFMLAFRFDEAGQIVDQWLGSNFVEILA